MFREICDDYIIKDFFGPGKDLQKENRRYITFEYNIKNNNDIKIINTIKKILYKDQPLCENCKSSEKIDNIYLNCKINGFLDSYQSKNPEHDGTLCKNYEKKI